MENIDKIVIDLCKQSSELPYLEFKHNNYKTDIIGEIISALSNSATLYEHDFAYMLWGIRDDTHKVVGTDHNLQNLKFGKEELENWLRNLLSSNANFEFKSVSIQEKHVGVLIIRPALMQPVTFRGIAYIRVGSYTKKLKDFTILESSLWRKMHDIRF